MGFLQNLFGRVKALTKFTHFRELGTYEARFTPFGADLYKSDITRACIRPLAEHTSKASVKSSSKALETILTYQPNPYMSGKDFLSKCRNILEVKNTLFIYIKRDEKGKAVGFYPVPFQSYEALEYNNRLYIRFTFKSTAMTQMVAAWDDLAVMRKDYLNSDIGGEDNRAIFGQLELIETTNQGVANAVKATANLRGILKNSKTMLDPEDVKRQRDQFVKDYLNLSNEGGIASLDATQEFIPISMSPTVTNSAQMKEFRENVYRYFGVSDPIVMSAANEEELEAFYSARIEPFLVALSLELTRKVFTPREIGWGNFIRFTSSRLEYCSLQTKLKLVSLVDRGALTPNEWRQSMGLDPIEGGDEPIRRLDTASVADQEAQMKEEQEEEKPAEKEPAEEEQEEENESEG